MYTTIFLNGKPVNCFSDTSLHDLLAYYEFNLDSIIVEYNKRVIAFNYFHSIILKPKDTIEVITIVGGG